MARRRKSKRPSSVVLGPFRARIARGPRSDSRYYWRISRNDKAKGCIWATKEELEEDLARRMVGVPVQEEIKRPTTLGELCKTWLSEQLPRTDIEPTSTKTFQNAVSRIVRVAEDWSLDEVKHNLHRIRDSYLADGLAASSVRYDLKVLRRIMKYGALHDWCSPVLPRIPVKGPQPYRRTPTPVEADRIGELFTDSEFHLAYAVVRVTGCRGIALDRLDWSNVNLATGLLKLIGKGRRQREVPIPEHLVEALGRWWKRCGQPETGPVFGHVVRTRLRSRVQRACVRQGIEPFGLHGLRRLRVREYRRGNVPVRVAADLLGHSPAVMLGMYDKADEADKRAALKALWSHEDTPSGDPDERA